MGSFHHYGEGAPFSRKGPHLTGEIGPPGPHITGRMGPGGPILPVIWGPGGPNLGGPHSTVTPEWWPDIEVPLYTVYGRDLLDGEAAVYSLCCRSTMRLTC